MSVAEGTGVLVLVGDGCGVLVLLGRLISRVGLGGGLICEMIREVSAQPITVNASTVLMSTRAAALRA